jgi:hypothetical protein
MNLKLFFSESCEYDCSANYLLIHYDKNKCFLKNEMYVATLNNFTWLFTKFDFAFFFPVIVSYINEQYGTYWGIPIQVEQGA